MNVIFNAADRASCQILLIAWISFGAVPDSSAFQSVPAETTGNQNPAQAAGTDDQDRSPRPLPELPDGLTEVLKGATPLNPQATVFLNKAENKVLLRTEVSCPDCVLEMVCVPEGRKEHETILRVRSQAFVIHSALLALGLEKGTRVSWDPEFRQPDGTTIQIFATWMDDTGARQRADIRTWVRHNIHRYFASPLRMPPPNIKLPYKELRYDKFTKELLWFGPLSDDDRDDLLSKWDDKQYQAAIHSFHKESQSRPMTADFVFVGSALFTDPQTGTSQYGAEEGHLICVSNFGDAMIDVREESTGADGAQIYEGWKEKIPPENTPVILELIPDDKSSDQAKPGDAAAEPESV